MSLSSMIRAAASGSLKKRAEGDTPEDDKEDEIPVEDDAEPKDDPAAEGDEPKDDEAAEDDADEKMSASSKRAFASGREAERARMAAIMGSPAADANPRLAAHLAFATGMSAKAAVAALKAGASAGGKLAGKMAGAGQPRLGGFASTGSGAASQPERIAAHAAAIIEAKRAKRVR